PSPKTGSGCRRSGARSGLATSRLPELLHRGGRRAGPGGVAGAQRLRVERARAVRPRLVQRLHLAHHRDEGGEVGRGVGDELEVTPGALPDVLAAGPGGALDDGDALGVAVDVQAVGEGAGL